jgi:HD-GYP domain-containing protein (c-di-GMP phosphodiesterase class II)
MGRVWDVGEGKRRSVAGVWPYVAATTSFVLVLPVGVVWLLRAMGVVGSAWVAAALGVCLSLLAAVAAKTAWTRWGAAGDVPFGDLLLWGWVRRMRAERKLTSAAAVLSASDAEDSAAQDRVLHQVAAALDAQDPYLDGHSKRVARYAAITAKRMGLHAEQVARVRAAATIHDVGKLRVPDEVIRKPAELTDAEG